MAARVVDPLSLAAALHALDAGRTPEKPLLQRAVLHLLGELAEAAPGRAIEVRVPPLGAVQCGEDPQSGPGVGPHHRRGTPPNVVEVTPLGWLRLATGRSTWREALDAGEARASGARADLSPWLPVAELPSTR